MRYLLHFGLLLPLLTVALPAAQAAPPRVELKQLCVDCVTLKEGPRLLGAIAERQADGSLTFAVERSWLERSAPPYYQKHHEDELDLLREGRARLPERIRTWMKRRQQDEPLQRFLASELVRVEQALADRRDAPATIDSQFVLIAVPAQQVQFVFVQPAERRQAALLAWQEKLDGVESRTAVQLLHELQQKGVEPPSAPIDLSDRLPGLPDDDRQWAARQALIEYDFRQRLDFQGTGETLFRTDDEAAVPALPQVLTAMFRAELDKQLGDLLGNGKPNRVAPQREFDSAIEAAQPLDVRGFRVMRLNQELAARRVSVDSQFVARMPDGSWETIWRDVQTADAAKDRAELEDRIAEDPRVKQALMLVETVAGDGATADLALKFAAATLAAQQEANDDFVEWRRRFTLRLDGPPLFWTRP